VSNSHRFFRLNNWNTRLRVRVLVQRGHNPLFLQYSSNSFASTFISASETILLEFPFFIDTLEGTTFSMSLIAVVNIDPKSIRIGVYRQRRNEKCRA
jgi:hypothetical protein